MNAPTALMFPYPCSPSVPRFAGSGMTARIDAARKRSPADMADHAVKSGFLWLIKDTLNRATIRIARSGRGPFTLVRHVGRKTGTTYKTPIIVPVPDGFVAELIYGPEVSWYRNIVAAGGCVIVFQGAPYQIAHIEPYNTQAGLRAFGYPRALILKALRRNEFRHLRC
jgi:hypothetical protein